MIGRPDTKLTEFLSRHSFTLSAEIIPPRNGSEQLKILTQVKALIEAGAQFLAVTKGAGGSLRGGSLPIAQAIKEQFGVPAIAHFTCRDLTAHEVENQLMDHHYFGIRNILALRGDPPNGAGGGQAPWTTRDGGYEYAYQLIERIKGLNDGNYLPRPGGPEADGQERTEFCIGAAAYPEHPNEEERIRFFKIKADAGAQFGMTDMCFDAEIYARFIDSCAKVGVTIPVLPGTRVLKTREQAQRMSAKFRVAVPSDTLSSLPSETDGGSSSEGAKRGVECFLRLTDRLKKLGAPGVHLYVISDTPAAADALGKLQKMGL